MNKAKLITLLVAIFCSVPGAYGSTVYTYTGNPFDTLSGPSGGSFDRITISLTFAQPLDPGTPDDTLLGWKISDGLFTIEPSSRSSLSTCQLYIDESGNIMGWLIAAYMRGDDGSVIVDLSTSPGIDQATLNDSEGQVSTASVAVPGTWTEHTLVPEPGYSALVLVALAAGFAWRRKRARA